MASSRVHSSPIKEYRRVLGDKTTNASLTPAKDHQITSKLSSIDTRDQPKKPFSPTQKAGRKRTIDELEESGTKQSTPQLTEGWTVLPTQDKFRIFEDSLTTLKEYPSQVCHTCAVFSLSFLPFQCASLYTLNVHWPTQTPKAPTSPTELGSPIISEGERGQGHDSVRASALNLLSESNFFTNTASRSISSERSVPSQPQARRLFVREVLTPQEPNS
jgi:hypothetical protein